MPTRTRTNVDEGTIKGFAREWAEYRLGGCPSGFYPGFKKRVEKVAKKHGRSFSDLWAVVHKEAYVLIDADPRSRLSSQAE